ncbi:hypothetical protein SEA_RETRIEVERFEVER_58 [Streptomyces phage RetrieverFever]|uniref:Uncharacterized protein n=3 Tax=Flowerpowervirus flowerpower TaxID=2846396 RepID=A0A2U8UN08_9CAUD|nr:hypothetical protein HWB61_gp43 [Streptomyces phage FlowerPower]AWN05139.1 hypothetical protein SEA_FLOWERPOWER_58 [Streptomyces phage FlowerPower]QEA11260.1 hypothetical protein SEA_GEOSTIN_53 [Streptomyces phage Geostin]QFP94757.1 hypothetical protein SEA_FABIAN_56 [Streptomyces phage Fabian]QZD97104.1 hypothetical protein SEA_RETRIEVERFEVER_58 [Streptomyces phage RetrieverFever]
MMSWVALPFMSHVWHTNTFRMVLTEAEADLSPWKGHLYAYQPRSSMTSSPPYSMRIGPIGKTGHSRSSCVLRTIASLLEETQQGVCPEADNPLTDVGFALAVHSENGSLDVISLRLTLHLLERFERVETCPSLEFEPHPRRTENVTTLTACPCRFSMREYRPNVVSEDLLRSVATMLPTL